MNFKFHKLEIEGPFLIECSSYFDRRGSFSEIYRADDFKEYNIGPFIQENYSCSIKNVIRGLHYQTKPMEVGKLVSCPHGKIFDVVVDIRRSSNSFGKWTAAILENGSMLWVPAGFAHGFCVLSDTANVLYRQTQYYSKPNDRNIRWDDPCINIVWPTENPIVSEKDLGAPMLNEAFKAGDLL